MRPVPNESKIPPGNLLAGKYRVTREIGRGGMAAVYEAEQVPLNKRVAVKVLAAELSASKIVIERFFREARAAASVRSPYIVDVYDSGHLEDGRPFIAMELLEGESLYDRMARVRLIDPETTVRVIVQCAKGLLKAHAAGIVHRDLKPENIFITRQEDGDEVAKLLDFGLAKFYAPVAPDEKAARLTREGAVFGTPAYMSPEQVKGQGSVDHRADLWALGCMAFECLIGRPVWNTDQGVAMTFAAIATAPIPTPSKLRPDLPQAFDEWFKKALSRDPDKRFQTAKELADALTLAFGRPASVSMMNAHDLSDVEETIALNRAPMAGDGGPSANIAGAIAGALAQAPDMRAMQSSAIPLLSPTQPRPFSPEAAPESGRHPIAQELPDSGQRPPGASAADLPPMARAPSFVSVSQHMPQPVSPVRWVVSSVALVAASVTAFVVWSNVLRPQVFTPVVQSTATVAPTTSASAPEEVVPSTAEMKWLAAIAEGQRLFATGDTPGALHKLKDAQEMGAGPVAKLFIEQIKATEDNPGPCKVVGVGHPRVSIRGDASRPAIATVGSGALVTWTDDHEQAGHDHAWAVVVDDTGKDVSPARDLTPEATDVLRPSLLSVADRAVLLYSDRAGREAGVRVRWIDKDGRIGGSSTLVGAPRQGSFWPSIARSPDAFFVVWQDDRDKEGDDIFLRRLSSELEPQGNETRLTDYLSVRGKNANARVPAIAVASNTIFIVYKLEREPQHTIVRMRIPLSSSELATGLDERNGPGPKGGLDRELGDVAIVNEDKLPGDAPTVACASEGCFVAWNGEKGGSRVAMIEPSAGRVLWRKPLGAKSAHPTLAAGGANGAVAVSWFDGGKVKLAQLTRDGMGAVSVVGRVTGDQPRPSVANGKGAGEFWVTWQDFESGHTEAWLAKVACKP